MTSGEGRETTVIKTACNLGQEVNYKFFTLCEISRHKEKLQSSFAFKYLCVRVCMDRGVWWVRVGQWNVVGLTVK